MSCISSGWLLLGLFALFTFFTFFAFFDLHTLSDFYGSGTGHGDSGDHLVRRTDSYDAVREDKVLYTYVVSDVLEPFDGDFDFIGNFQGKDADRHGSYSPKELAATTTCRWRLADHGKRHLGRNRHGGVYPDEVHVLEFTGYRVFGDFPYKCQGFLATPDLDSDRLTTSGRVDGVTQRLSFRLKRKRLSATTVKVDRSDPGTTKCPNFFASYFAWVDGKGDVIGCHISITSSATGACRVCGV